MESNGQALNTRPRANEVVGPHDLTAERAIIGAAMVSEPAAELLLDKVKEMDFYSETHRVIWRCVRSLNSRSESIDRLTLVEELKTQEEFERIGGRKYIFELWESVPTAANATQYADIVKRYSLRRKLMDKCVAATQSAVSMEEDVYEVLGNVLGELSDLETDHSIESGDVHVGEIAPRILESLDSRLRNEGPVGVPTGFIDLDKLLGGLHDDDLIILGARPSMGKTAMALNIIVNAIKKGYPTVFYSMEMAEDDILERAACSESDTNLSAVRQGHESVIEKMPAYTREVMRLQQLPFYIDDDSSVTVPQMRSRLRKRQRLLRQQGKDLGLVVIDYLQLMHEDPKPDNRNLELSNITVGLKRLAKELKVPIVLLSQLSRGVEYRGDKRPILGDLRDSGAIEQDADLVMFIYRDAYYNENSEEGNTSEVLVRKHRNGPTGMVKLNWHSETATFQNRSNLSDPRPVEVNSSAYRTASGERDDPMSDTDPSNWDD